MKDGGSGRIRRGTGVPCVPCVRSDRQDRRGQGNKGAPSRASRNSSWVGSLAGASRTTAGWGLSLHFSLPLCPLYGVRSIELSNELSSRSLALFLSLSLQGQGQGQGARASRGPHSSTPGQPFAEPEPMQYATG